MLNFELTCCRMDLLSALIAWFSSCSEDLKPTLMALIEQLGSYSISGRFLGCPGACGQFLCQRMRPESAANSGKA